MKNRLRVKEIIEGINGDDRHNGVRVVQAQVACRCIPFNFNTDTKAQLLAKWNNGKALHKITCEVLFKLREALGCTYGELIGTRYKKAPKNCEEERLLIKKWIAYEDQCGNVLDALVKISNEYKVSVDFIFLTPEENQMI